MRKLNTGLFVGHNHNKPISLDMPKEVAQQEIRKLTRHWGIIGIQAMAGEIPWSRHQEESKMIQYRINQLKNILNN